MKRLFALTLILLTAIPSIVFAQENISLAINNVETVFDSAKSMYRVTAYISVIDSYGDVIQDLGKGDFEVTEDGKEISEFEIEPVESGISLVFAIDTSGSMRNDGKMDAVKDAASAFISGLGNQDKVGILSFHEEPEVKLDLTEDLIAAQNFVELIEPFQYKGTCLWDSGYEAIQLAASEETGRRAVVLLTDGIDLAPGGGVCSQKTLEDLINLASDSAFRVPVFTVGVGPNANKQDLTRLAELTGGRHLHAPSSLEVDSLFKSLSDQLRYGYQLSYFSALPSGEHSLFIQVTFEGSRDQEVRKFFAHELPASGEIIGLDDGQIVEGDLRFSVVVSGDTPPAKVDFYLGEIPLATDSEEPFEVDWVAENYEEGPFSIRAVAYDSSGNVLAETRKSFFYQPVIEDDTDVESQPIEVTYVVLLGLTDGQVVEEAVTVEAQITGPGNVSRVVFYSDDNLISEDASAPFQVDLDDKNLGSGEHRVQAIAFGSDGSVVAENSILISVPESGFPYLWLIIAIPLILGGSIVAYRRMSDRREWVPPVIPGKSSRVAKPGVVERQKLPTLAEFTIVDSHDERLIGQKFDIWEKQIVVGRSDDCDIVIPTQPVSRFHAYILLGGASPGEFQTMDEIVFEDLQKEQDASPDTFYIFDGHHVTKSPSTYGTFVDDERVEEDGGTPLTDGCEIRLGRFEIEGRVTPVKLHFRDVRIQHPKEVLPDLTSEFDLDEYKTEEELELPGMHAGAGNQVDILSVDDKSTAETDKYGTEEFSTELEDSGERPVVTDLDQDEESGLSRVEEEPVTDPFGTEEFISLSGQADQDEVEPQPKVADAPHDPFETEEFIPLGNGDHSDQQLDAFEISTERKKVEAEDLYQADELEIAAPEDLYGTDELDALPENRESKDNDELIDGEPGSSLKDGDDLDTEEFDI